MRCLGHQRYHLLSNLCCCLSLCASFVYHLVSSLWNFRHLHHHSHTDMLHIFSLPRRRFHPFHNISPGYHKEVNNNRKLTIHGQLKVTLIDKTIGLIKTLIEHIFTSHHHTFEGGRGFIPRIKLRIKQGSDPPHPPSLAG